MDGWWTEESNGAGLRHIDVRDPYYPQDMPVPDVRLGHQESVHAVAVDGENVILAGFLRGEHLRLLRANLEPSAGPTPTPEVWDDPEPALEGWDRWYTLRHGDSVLIVNSMLGLADTPPIMALDLSRPAGLQLIEYRAGLETQWQNMGFLPSPPALAGDHLYVPFASGLHIYDLAGEGPPREVGVYDTSPVSPSALVGDILWSVEQSWCTDEGEVRHEIRSYRLGGPGELTPLGSARLPPDVDFLEGVDFLVADESLLVVVSRWGDLHAFDVRDPARPVTAGTVDRSTERAKACEGATTQHCGPGLVGGASLLGSLLVVGYAEWGVQFYEVTHPPRPFAVTTSQFNEGPNSYASAWLLAGKGSTVWSASRFNSMTHWALAQRDRGPGEGFAAKVPTMEGVACLGIVDAATAVVGEAKGYSQGTYSQRTTLRVYQRPAGEDPVARGQVALHEFRPHNLRGPSCHVLADEASKLAFVEQLNMDGDVLHVVDLADLDHPVPVGLLERPPGRPLAMWRGRLLLRDDGGGLSWWRLVRGP